MGKEKIIEKYIYGFSFLIIVVALFSVIAVAQDPINETAEENEGKVIAQDVVNETAEEKVEDLPSDDGAEDILEEDEKEFKDAELEQGAGITPDSAFYFIDKFFDRFGSDLANKEERVAEIKAMIQAGKTEEAKEALRRYQEYAKKVEAEIDPEQQNEVRRSAVAIKKTIEEIEGSIPEENKEEFNEIIASEGRIAVAAKVANKIKELCESLSKLDPLQYEQVCKTKEGDDAPRWQRRLDQKLTKEQEQEAEKFFRVMSNCFRDPATCRCEEISVTAFAEKCKVVAPLAAKCEQQGDEEACDEMDKETEGMEDLLPEHLQYVMARVEEEFGDAEFENHMPPECREAGIDFRDRDARKKCGTVMFEANAPEECVKALKEGKLDISNERKAREQCEEIMFRENAPQECIDAGIKDFKECGKFMFKQNAPQECVDAGLTGESPRDGRKCEEIMKQQGGDRGRGPSGRGPPAFGRNCKDIPDVQEKLKCLEEFYNAAQQGGFPGQGGTGEQGDGRGFPPECEQAGARTQDSCEKIMREKYGSRDERREGSPEGGLYPQPGQYPQGCDCSTVRCEAGSYPSCEGGSSCGCVRAPEGQQPPATEHVAPPATTTTEPAPVPEQPAPPPSETTSPPSSEPVPINDNRFVRYYFRFL